MDKMDVFVALTGFAVLLQACVLLAMYLAMRKSGERMEALVAEVKTKLLPSVEQAQEMLTVMRPKIEVIADNLQDATTVLRSQVHRVDATVNDVVDRARLQVIRADELFSRTLDRVENTSDMVHSTVVSPIRQVSGIIQGVTAGLEFLLGKSRRNGNGDARRPVPQDEMFI